MSVGEEKTERDHLFDVLEEFDTAMLVTRSSVGELRSRPMAVAERREDGDGKLYFATRADSPKVDELEADPTVNVSFQSRTRFASVSGQAHVSRDRALIERLWSETWKTWFPGGKDDPELCVVVVDPDEGAYWDQSGAKGLRYLFRAVRAYATGTTPNESVDSTGKVRL